MSKKQIIILYIILIFLNYNSNISNIDNNTKVNNTKNTIISSNDLDSIYLTKNVEDINKLLVTEQNNNYNNNNAVFIKPSYHISENGIQFIKKFESCSLKKYKYKRKNDTYENYYTIGWGHVLYPNDKYYNRKSITQAEADQLFIDDTKWLNQACNNLISELSPHFKPTQGFIDGLCSLIYNCGENGVRNSKFFISLKNCRYSKDKENGIYYINEKDYAYCMTLVKYTKISEAGHKPRRKAESKLMASVN